VPVHKWDFAHAFSVLCPGTYYLDVSQSGNRPHAAARRGGAHACSCLPARSECGIIGKGRVKAMAKVISALLSRRRTSAPSRSGKCRSVRYSFDVEAKSRLSFSSKALTRPSAAVIFIGVLLRVLWSAPEDSDARVRCLIEGA